MTKYFGTDGVRGIANKELSPEMAFRLGRTGGYVLTQHKRRCESTPIGFGCSRYTNLRADVG